MDYPDKTLLALIYDNWTLTTEGLKVTDIVFSQVDWRWDDGLQGVPNIVVQKSTLRRLAEVEEYFAYNATVKAVYWSKTKNHADAVTDKDKIWAMVEHVKKILHTSSLCPATWNYMKVDAVNTRNEVPPLPQILQEELIVNIRLFWVP